MSYIRVSYNKLKEFCDESFQRFGFTKQESDIITNVLLLSDLYGIESHGLQRMRRYHKSIEIGMVKTDVASEILFETPVSAIIDAHFRMGQLAAHHGMSLAIEKAKKSGVGIVSIKNSNHFGIAGFYSKMACDENLIGISFTNSEAIMVPTFGSIAMIGTNPIAFAMPAQPYNFMFDASTTVVTRGKLEVYKKLNKEVPEGWILDQHGHPSTDVSDVLINISAKKGGGITPLGGNDETLGGHKGYGFGMISEIFSSILSLGFTSNNCLKGGIDGCCHGFIAIDPKIFGDAEAIKQHLSSYLQEIRESRKAEGQERIYTHGEKEILAVEERMNNGILINKSTMLELYDLCTYLKMDFSKYFGDYNPLESGAVIEDMFKNLL